MRSYEWLAFVYFGVLAVAAWIQPLPTRRRMLISAIGVTMAASTLPRWRPAGFPARDVGPLAWMLIGYLLSGLFFVRPSERFEAWLLAWDRRLLGDPTTRFARWPPALLAFLDIIYMGCFLLVPAGFVALAIGGHDSLADRYWTMVIAAELGAFLSLGFVQTRPPWAIERERARGDRAVHRAASSFVRALTHRANTFPSGHAAGSVAVALAIVGVLPLLGTVLLALALCICLACVVGRYHYTIDVVAGIALALAIWIAVSLG